jgi:large subunit ribosomal protein L28
LSTRCDICGKGTTFGRNIRHKHSGRWQRKAPRTNRVYRPNLHKQNLWVGGQRVKLNICTRCLRSQMKVAR